MSVQPAPNPYTPAFNIASYVDSAQFTDSDTRYLRLSGGTEKGAVTFQSNLTSVGDLVVNGGVLKVDTDSSRLCVCVNKSSPAYPVDVVGDVNSSTAYRVGGTAVLNKTSLLSTVVSSSLTSVGTLSGLSLSSPITAYSADGIAPAAGQIHSCVGYVKRNHLSL